VTPAAREPASVARDPIAFADRYLPRNEKGQS
jgi:hypothetical protein